jgi:hypothetical protein
MRTVVAAAEVATGITVWVEGGWSFWRNAFFFFFSFFLFGHDFLATILENGVVAGEFCSRSV